MEPLAYEKGGRVGLCFVVRRQTGDQVLNTTSHLKACFGRLLYGCLLDPGNRQFSSGSGGRGGLARGHGGASGGGILRWSVRRGGGGTECSRSSRILP